MHLRKCLGKAVAMYSNERIHDIILEVMKHTFKTKQDSRKMSLIVRFLQDQGEVHDNGMSSNNCTLTTEFKEWLKKTKKKDLKRQAS